MEKVLVSPIAEKIYRAWEKQGKTESSRTYLGASEIGHECEMYLWLKFRGAIKENHDGRMYRLFNRGQREEEVFVQDLKMIGCDVKDRDANGNQFSVTALGGHFAGHLDAIACGIPEAPKTWHVVEMKTHNEQSFKKLCKEGVEKAKPMHYAQMQVYMGLSNATRALYIAVNKNTDELYTERVHFNKNHFDLLMAKAKRIIDTCTPDKCATRPDDYRCKMCPAKSLCWAERTTIIDPYLNCDCRKCCHATANTESYGKSWSCRLGNACSTVKCDCSDFLILPTFVDGEPIDATEESITYKKDEVTFLMGDGGFLMSELQKVSIDQLLPIIAVKSQIPTAKVIDSVWLNEKYKDMCDIFSGTIDETRKHLTGFPIVDWGKPRRTESCKGYEFFEYDDYVLVINKELNKGILKSLPAPF